MVISSVKVEASSVNNLLDKRDEVTEQKNITKNKIDTKTSEIEVLGGQLVSITHDTEKIVKEIKNNESELNLLEKEIKINTERVELAEKNFKEKQSKFESRIRVMYMNKDVGYLELLLSSNDIKDFFSRKEMAKVIAEKDKEQLEEIKAEKDAIELTKSALITQKHKLVVAKAELEANKSAMEDLAKEKEELTNKISKEIKEYEKQYDELNRTADEISAEIIKLQSEQQTGGVTGGLNSNSNKSGNYSSNKLPNTGKVNKMSWPVSGSYRVSSPFGYRIHPIFQTRKLHTGIDIPAPAGRQVTAAASGVVISSGWMGGYGNTVIIDHGAGLVTLYAHNSSLETSKGSYVSEGQTISRIGSTGNSTGPHLHFEVRQNGEYVNPMPWLN